MTNLATPHHPIHTELLDLRLSDAPPARAAWIERIDEDHANPRQPWRKMGEPEYLSALQVAQLETVSTLRKEAQPWTQETGTINLAVALPPQIVAAITIEFA
jgi:xylan 1,4-beta-xylosidase